MTLKDFETKALQVLLSQRFLTLPLFEEEELSEYHVADNQGEMNLEDFIRQYAEVIMNQFKADYESRLKADLKAILVELQLEIEEIVREEGGLINKKWADGLHYSEKIIQQKINKLRGETK